MTEPLPLPTGARVRVRTPGPSNVVYMPVAGPTGPRGAYGGADTAYGEVPTGAKDGTNTVFTLAQTPVVSSMAVYRNGLREILGVGYTAAAATITFTTAPLSSDVLTVDYLRSESD